jgi:hypothetical protein
VRLIRKETRGTELSYRPISAYASRVVGGVQVAAAADSSVGIFDFIPGYREVIQAPGKEPLLVVFLSFLIAFALTRGYTRAARKKGWGSGSIGGVHLHHSVPGLILALVGGGLAYTSLSDNAWVKLLGAILFGVGAALVLDEFALILHLEDVYWSEEGRSSLDATIIAAISCGAALLVSTPFGIHEVSDRPFLIAFIVIAFNVVWVLTCFFKSKPFAGAAGIAITPIALVGAIRLAKPESPWAHKLYAPLPGHELATEVRAHKLARARVRAANGFGGRFRTWFEDLIGGKPGLPPLPTAEDFARVPFVGGSTAQESPTQAEKRAQRTASEGLDRSKQLH